MKKGGGCGCVLRREVVDQIVLYVTVGGAQ